MLTVSGDAETEKEGEAGEAIETLRETACHGQARPSPTHTADTAVGGAESATAV